MLNTASIFKNMVKVKNVKFICSIVFCIIDLLMRLYFISLWENITCLNMFGFPPIQKYINNIINEKSKTRSQLVTNLDVFHNL